MRNFRTLFKYERRMLFPGSRGKRFDLFGALTSLIFTLAIAGVFGLLIYAIADGYLDVKSDRVLDSIAGYHKLEGAEGIKVLDPMARAYELLNAVYTIIITALGIMCLEKMRSTLTRSSDTPIFLRLPVKKSTIFRAKFTALLLWTYVAAFLLIVPVNLIFYFVLEAEVDFLLRTLLIYLLLPMASFLLATVLILPYMVIIKFLSTRYFLSFVAMSGLAVGAFYVYSGILNWLRQLFESGSIRFLFSEDFEKVLTGAERYTYPAKSLASVQLGVDMKMSLIISISVAVVALLATFFITGGLYNLVLYKNREGKKSRAKRSLGFQRSVLGSLVRKEFVTVYREPKYLFSYFTIAFAMPFMIFCSYTLLDELVYNAIGKKLEFALALIVVLVFSILTNTFCATNITRDGKSALKAKSFPIKASKLLFSKVLFCGIISSISVIASVLFLYFSPNIFPDVEINLEVVDAVIVCAIGLVFSFSQILMATRTDLNCAVVDASPAEVARASDRTIAKVVSIGLLLAVVIGLVTFFVSVFAGVNPSLTLGIAVKKIYAYIIPAIIAAIYFAASILYYHLNIEKAFAKLTK